MPGIASWEGGAVCAYAYGIDVASATAKAASSFGCNFIASPCESVRGSGSGRLA